MVPIANKKRFAILVVLGVIGIEIFLGLMGVGFFYIGLPEMRHILHENWMVIYGLPTAGAITFSVVFILFTGEEGLVQFKVFGLEFSGPGGPVVLWVFSFLSVVFALKILS